MANKKTKALSHEQLTAISRIFAVLSEPSRLILLQALQAGPQSVNELVAASGMKQANVSKHLAVLHSQHLVKRERDGVTIRYEIADPMIFSLCNLVCTKMERDSKEAAAIFSPEI